MKQLCWTQSQAELFEVVLQRILSVLQSADGAAQRSKALRSLGSIVAEDGEIFGRVSSFPHQADQAFSHQSSDRLP